MESHTQAKPPSAGLKKQSANLVTKRVIRKLFAVTKIKEIEEESAITILSAFGHSTKTGVWGLPVAVVEHIASNLFFLFTMGSISCLQNIHTDS